MQSKYTRRGETQNNHLTNCHSRGLLSGIYNASRCKNAVMLNSFQHLHLVQTCGKKEEILNQVQDDNMIQTTRGFTLIELLVVVLIIGILAAVAVPQYKLAVVKSKTKAILPVLSAIQRAQEVYYLSNGQYVKDVSKLDIQMPTECTSTSDANTNWVCGTDFHVVTNTHGSITASYCPGHTQSVHDCIDYRDFSIRWGFDNCSEENCGNEDQYPTKLRLCLVRNNSALGEKICKVFFND